jgi:hypothetical protein
MTRVRFLVTLSAAVLTIGVAAPAAAQTAPLPKKTQKTQKKPAAAAAPARPPTSPGRADKKTAGRKVVRLEEMRVEGRIQKPQALMLMPRASVASGDTDRAESFLPMVKDATQQEPF